MERRVTLRDVAAACGVHPSTVSRILRGDQERVRPDTVERVVKQADTMGYTTDRWAASLRSGRTGVLGMLVPRITDVVLATVFEAFEDEAAECGYLALVASTWDDHENRSAAIKRFLEQRVDGIVVADARLVDPDLERIQSQGTPLLLVSRRTAGLPFVTGDDRGGGRLAGLHLGERGVSRVAVIGGPAYASTSRDRTEGFLEGLAEHGKHDVTIIASGFDLESGQRATDELLKEDTPDAVFVVNDFAALGAMSALARHGLQPGRDVAVVGYNDIEISSELPIPMSSVRADLDAMGREAFRSIRDLIDGRQPADVFVPTELLVRESSMTPDPEGNAG